MFWHGGETNHARRFSLRRVTSLKVTMQTKGTFYMRAFMEADALNKSAYSTPNKKLVVN